MKHDSYQRKLQDADRDDLVSELKRTLFVAIRGKYKTDTSVGNRWNYTVTVAKNRLQSWLVQFMKRKTKQKHYEDYWEGRAAEDDARERSTALIYIDGLPGIELSELFVNHLNIKQTEIIWLRYCGHSNEDIAEQLKLSKDYVRKLYRQAELVLAEALNIPARHRPASAQQ